MTPIRPDSNAHAGAEHPNELLLLVADGTRPPPKVASHLAGCGRCRGVLVALAPLDLDYAWDGIAAELDAPQGWVGRLLVLLGADNAIGRCMATTPSLMPAWLLANAAVLTLALVLQSLLAQGLGTGSQAGQAALVVAPLLAAAAVAFAYGPAVDPAYELVAVTPFSAVRALLARLAAVLTVNAVLVATADALAGQGLRLGWLAPMAAVALLAAMVAARTTSVAGAVTGGSAWLLVLLLARAASARPAAWLSTPTAQAACALAAAALLALLARQAQRDGWALPPGTA